MPEPTNSRHLSVAFSYGIYPDGTFQFTLVQNNDEYYSFSEAQKVSIWRSDGEKCFYCRIPVPYSELQVDHIGPEKIPSDKLVELQPVFPSNFEINSIPNWVTCHQGCNIRKSAYIFEKPALLYYLEMAQRRAGTVQKNLDDFEVQKQNGRLLGTLGCSGGLTGAWQQPERCTVEFTTIVAAKVFP